MTPPTYKTIAQVLLLLVLGEVIASGFGLPLDPLGSPRKFIETPPFVCAAFLAATLIAFSHPLSRRFKIRVALVGVIAEVLLASGRLAIGMSAWDIFLLLGLGIGLVTLISLAFLASKRSTAPEIRDIAYEAAILPLYVLASGPLLFLTTILLPRLYDPHFAFADLPFNDAIVHPIIGFVTSHKAIRGLCAWAYQYLPLALGAAHVVTRNAHENRNGSPVLSLFVVLGACGFLIYLLVPVVGPLRYASEFGALAALDSISQVETVIGGFTAPRNCIPSLHVAWALAAFLAIPKHRLLMRGLLGTFLALTVLATVGLSWHYFVDLVLAVPFTVGLAAWLGRHPAQDSLFGNGWSRTFIVSAIVFFFTLGLYVFLPLELARTPWLSWSLALVCIAVPFVCDRWERQNVAGIPAAAVPIAVAAPSPRFAHLMTALFVASGLSALVIEVVFSRSMALTFGSTSTAQSTVLATYMGGMALGAWWGGKWASTFDRPLKIYAYCELCIAVYALCAPMLLQGMQELYVVWVQGKDYPTSLTTGLQFTLGALVLLPPTVLMGATTPSLLAHFSRGGEHVASAVARLYAANTVGAAMGALVAAYFFLPTFGVWGTLCCASAFSMAAALGALRSAKAQEQLGESALSPAPEKQAEQPARTAIQAWIGLCVLGIGGVVTLALEGIYVHLLAVVVGCSTYAFGLMLACFLAGLGAGSMTMRRLYAKGYRPESLLSWTQLGIASALTLGLLVWNEIPDYFASFAQSPLTITFGIRELIRFFVCVVAMVPPAFFVGLSYPCAMSLFVEARPADTVAAMGRASAINTVGNVVGALLGGFALIPWLGSYHSVLALATVSGVLALVATFAWTRVARIQVLIAAMSLCGVMIALPADFDFTRLASGANVYFTPQNYGDVIDHAESVDGGLTTVTVHQEDDGPVHTLLTNGKFQGDDSLNRETKAQYGFGLIPLLHGDGRDQALVIGIGTGCTAKVVVDAGFRTVHLVDLSADILRMADKHFSTLNGAVLRHPRTITHVADGRNFLLTSDQNFDLITMEISSIWFASAANLYNQEFYRLAKGRLSEHGVLQQWMQLHRMRPEEIATILATIHQEFEHVWLYFVKSQGMIVACNHDCKPTSARIAALEADPGLKSELAAFGGGTQELINMMLLHPQATQSFISDVSDAMGGLEYLISNDDNLRLEYATPRGNVMPYRASLEMNLRVLHNYKN